MVDQKDILLDLLTVHSAYDVQAIQRTGDFTFLSKLSGLPQVWKLDENDEPIQFIHAHDRVQSVYHSPSGDRTVVGIDREGNEKQQLYIVGAAGGTPEVLVESLQHFHHCGGWSPDGKYISYSSNRRSPGYFDVFVMDVDTKEVKQVFTHNGNCIPLGWVDEQTLFVNVKETNIDSTIHVVCLQTGNHYQIGDHDVLARYEAPVMKKDGEVGYVLTDENEEMLYLSAFSIDEPDELTKLLHWDSWDIDAISLAPKEDVLAFCLNEGGMTKLGMYNTSTGEWEWVENIPNGVIGSMSWRSENALLFTLKTPTEPGDVWEYDRLSGTVTRLTSIGKFETSRNLVEPGLYTYRSFDGLQIPYFMYHQGQPDNKPAIIYVHGGPESQTKAEYNPIFQFLVYQGFTVVAPNIRGSKGYGRSYIKLDDADKRLDAVADLASLAKELTDAHQVLPHKIGIMGRSYGGFMVLAALSHYPNLWAAGVDIVGMSNLKTFLQNTGEWRRGLREYEYGSLDVYSDYFDKIAPMNLSENITAPLLVFHGRNDSRVPVSEAEQLVQDLESRDRDVELIVFEDEGHQTSKIENHVALHIKTVQFLNRHLNQN
ncbi:alpha/beta fold hydrolase [Sporosarcina sp. OR05]|uniref:S9 family peptidase n=1 Tax=Sporosarcina sp. OR05 TaxID=2969819 RepID=UPI00352B3695